MRLTEVGDHYQTHTSWLQNVLFRMVEQNLRESVVLIHLMKDRPEKDRDAIVQLINRRGDLTIELQEAAMSILEDVTAMVQVLNGEY